ncbi:MAG: TetR/AcrR family transcriptional regulator [Helicobacteraceae bacterium]|jgi:TetR/AcrR family transcriptional repressor of cmeABC operon|nr:TetR/AcrR family transcriptional regulator [Helicobacteraceae bacterium]
MIIDRLLRSKLKKERRAEESQEERQYPNRNRFLEAAFDEFADRGFSKVGMREIIRKSGGSFSTVYKWFGCKEGLLAAALEHKMQSVAREFERVAEHFKDAPLEECLNAFAMELLGLMFNEKTARIHRLLISEGVKGDAKLGRRLAKAAIEGHMQILADYIQKQQEKGLLREGDPLVAAMRFVGCLKGSRHIRAIVTGEWETMDRSQTQALATEATRFFLYGFHA